MCEERHGIRWIAGSTGKIIGLPKQVRTALYGRNGWTAFARCTSCSLLFVAVDHHHHYLNWYPSGKYEGASLPAFRPRKGWDGSDVGRLSSSSVSLKYLCTVLGCFKYSTRTLYCTGYVRRTSVHAARYDPKATPTNGASAM